MSGNTADRASVDPHADDNRASSANTESTDSQSKVEASSETRDSGDRPSTPQQPNENWEAVNEPE
ncbi:hypothetical protein IQ268_23725 [Oculatella sp. LEGE 06141]|uniref:hypothetical protein n=1 Tax=Oculatella sp. LEGE 06141 TaxID=1828648 RepID=UPI0018802D3D|nr:hypothetical protein [Oculatella sp. LEGE 06141]MBE9181577.1 hypothetical protein [Oculatella sp. LEGE 06141]